MKDYQVRKCGSELIPPCLRLSACLWFLTLARLFSVSLKHSTSLNSGTNIDMSGDQMTFVLHFLIWVSVSDVEKEKKKSANKAV